MESVPLSSMAEIEKAMNVVDGDEEDQHITYAMQLVSSATLPFVLCSVIQLGVLEVIARSGGSLTASEIASRLPARENPDAPEMLDRMLRLLASYSVVTCSGSDDGEGRRRRRVYGLAPVGKYFIRNEDGATLGTYMAMIHNRDFMDNWFELNNAILEGGVPCARIHGQKAYEYFDNNPEFVDNFNKSMIDHTLIAMKRIVECYKRFEQIKQLVDVGGGWGVTLGMIISRYPKIKGINFDLPNVVQRAPSYPGVEHVGGDMFVSVPKGDAIFLKWILHNWKDEDCIKLLKKCYEALTEDGKVIVVEEVLKEIPDTSASQRSTIEMDMMMMVHCAGGRERTGSEFQALAMAAGFRGVSFVCFACNYWVMEFYKL